VIRHKAGRPGGVEGGDVAVVVAERVLGLADPQDRVPLIPAQALRDLRVVGLQPTLLGLLSQSPLVLRAGTLSGAATSGHRS